MSVNIECRDGVGVSEEDQTQLDAEEPKMTFEEAL